MRRGAHASAGEASSAAEPAQDAGGAAAAEVSDGEAPGAGGAGAADSGDDATDPLDGWPTFMQDWATLYGIYRQKEDELQTQAIRCAGSLHSALCSGGAPPARGR